MSTYKIKVYKKDGRTKTGERLVKEIEHTDVSGDFMMEEARYLRKSKYKAEDGYKVEW